MMAFLIFDIFHDFWSKRYLKAKCTVALCLPVEWVFLGENLVYKMRRCAFYVLHKLTNRNITAKENCKVNVIGHSTNRARTSHPILAHWVKIQE